MPPNFKPDPLDCPIPPITIAAVGPVMMNVAGQECDGARLHVFCTRDYLENKVLPRLTSAMSSRGRSRENFEITGGGFVATGKTDEAVAKAFEWVRMRIGFYGSTRAYWPVFAEHDLQDLGEKLNHMSKTNQWAQMTNEVSDDVVHLFAAVGRHDELTAAVTERFGGLVDSISISTPIDDPTGPPPDLIQDLQAIPSPFAHYAGH